MTMTSLVEMARQTHQRGRGRVATTNSMTYAVHKQGEKNKRKNSLQCDYRVLISIGQDIWENARLRLGDSLDFQMDFSDGEGVISRIQDLKNKSYPRLFKKTKKGKCFTTAFTFNYTKGMPFIRSAEKLSNIQCETGKIYFEFTTKQMKVLESMRLKRFFPSK